MVAEIEAAWAEPQVEWARRRLLVVRLIAQHELTVAQIMRVAEVSRQSVFVYRDKVVAGGVAGLLERKYGGGPRAAVRGAVQTELIQRLEAGQFRQARDAQAWIKKRTRQTLSESGVRQLLRRLGGKLKVPRKSHAKKDPAQAAQFKAELPARLAAIVGPEPETTRAAVGARRAPLRTPAGDPTGLGPAGRASARSLCDQISMGLPARSLGSGWGARRRTFIHPRHRPGDPRPFSQADR